MPLAEAFSWLLRFEEKNHDETELYVMCVCAAGMCKKMNWLDNIELMNDIGCALCLCNSLFGKFEY